LPNSHTWPSGVIGEVPPELHAQAIPAVSVSRTTVKMLDMGGSGPNSDGPRELAAKLAKASNWQFSLLSRGRQSGLWVQLSCQVLADQAFEAGQLDNSDFEPFVQMRAMRNAKSGQVLVGAGKGEVGEP